MQLPVAEKLVYVGKDWILYASWNPGDFKESDMIAPALILSPPGAQYKITMDEKSVFAPAFLHPGSARSAGAGPGLVLLYLDPLSAEGRAIQRYCQGAVLPCEVPGQYDATDFEALVAPQCTTEEICLFVSRCCEFLRATLPEEPALDDRLVKAALYVATHLDTRLNLTKMSEVVKLSPDYMRERFRKVTGTTFSRYQMWKRLHTVLEVACALYRTGEDVSAPLNTVMQNAGFFDVSHGSRAVSQYFGLASPLAAGLSMRFYDCRT